MALLLLLAACTKDAGPCVPTVEVPSDGKDQDCDGVDLVGVTDTDDTDDTDDIDPGLSPGVRVGSGLDSSFGHAVALDGAALVVGAPFFRVDGGPAGQVSRDGVVLATGAPGDRLGSSIAALDDGTILFGAPGAGEVRSARGEILASGAGVGRILAARGDRWVTSSASGALWDDGTAVTWAGPPDALLILPDGTLVGGYARGDVAVYLGSSSSMPRPQPQDEAGYALTSWEPLGGGRTELLVGAPGSGIVYRVDPDAPAWDRPVAGAGGRFGASLAAETTAAWIGAPMDGTEAQGAVYTIDTSNVSTRIATGAAPGDQLGFSLLTGADAVLAGAPGTASGPGSVVVQAR